MRVVVTSDTHIGRRRRSPIPAALLSACEGADLILHAGDVTDPAVLEELAGYAPLAAVHGNVDGWDMVERLPARRVVDVGGVDIGMVHDAGQAAGRAARLRGRFPSCRVVVFGHTHEPLCEWDAGLLLLNPGSPTERRRAPRHTYAELTVDDGDVAARIVPIDKDAP